MKIKSIKKIISDKPIKFYDITTEKSHSFLIGDSKIHVHNSSLTGALNKLARPFGNALQILDGYGFFGSEVSPDPAAARYTSVKLSPKTNDILNKYKYLTTRIPEGPYDPLWMDVPLGLTTSIVGIAVGYKTTILPRKLEHIIEFLEGKRKSVKPYFHNFNGSIAKYTGNKLDSDCAWLLSSLITIENKRIKINEIPPVLKYTSALKKLDYIINKYEGKVRIINNSNTKVNVEIVYLGKNQEEWDELQRFVTKAFSIIVTENPVFIKDNQVLVYQNIEQYLTDYKWQISRLKYRNTEYEHLKLKFDLEFAEAKKLFIEFILEKKRTNLEIDEFLKSYHKELRSRLEGLTTRKFTKDELTATVIEIKDLIERLKNKLKDFNAAKKDFESLVDPTQERGVNSKKIAVNLFDTEDTVESIDGITIWSGDDIYYNEDESRTLED